MPHSINNIIIGASGLIGGALYRHFVLNGEKAVGTYATHGETPDLIKFDMEHPDYSWLTNSVGPGDNVYIMAAYSNPSWIFANRAAARNLNLDATIGLIEALRASNPRIIFMSSVEVFDGLTGGYKEFDEPNPLNYYGSLKYEVEEYLRNSYEKSTIVRTGWNIGMDARSRCVVKLTYDSLLKPNAMMAVDNLFSISDVEDTANALRQVGKHPELAEIHICSDAIVRRNDLASLIVGASRNGGRMVFRECNFSDIPYSEPRGRLNDLSNALSRDVLGMKYRAAHDIIADKVQFIDNEI
jgi:dTDP-4-dehydrorhamnose reductase